MPSANKLKLLILASICLIFTFSVITNAQSQGPKLYLDPGTSAMDVGSRTIDVYANLGTQSVRSIDLVVVLSGTIPQGLTFTPSTITGLTVKQNAVQDSTNPVGKLVVLGLGTPEGGAAFSSTAPVMLGTIGFTAPSTGTLNANIDENRSGAYNATGNVIQAYEDATYTFGGGGSTEVSNTTIKVFLEGVYKSGGVIPRNQDFLVEFKNTAGNVVKEATVNAVAADANAIYSINVPEVPYGTHKACVKSRSHLKRCQTGVVVNAATTSIQWLGVGTDGKVDKSKMLLVGDVVGNTNQAGEFETASIEKNNIINNSDREWAKSWFQFLENPVSNENRNADVDGDNLIKQQDIALILANINYSEAGVLGTPGDN